ncbi:unnamed protein product [Thelazia callipaeda]|uniref:Uncharacterized protein n=1 Tax=Thelazia callipaeda TaxID=103827 RepID=A0A0N5D7T8_THECL|nr:unnamed protein product [Thelazia callipaeda]
MQSDHLVENDTDLADDNTEQPYERSVTPTTTVRRAKESFLRHQNDIFKEYEEQIMDTDVGECGPVNESDVGEVANGLSDRDESRNDAVNDKDIQNSSKERVEFCVGPSESSSVSSTAALSSIEARSTHPKN